jgi:hypothetical protein
MDLVTPSPGGVISVDGEERRRVDFGRRGKLSLPVGSRDDGRVTK